MKKALHTLPLILCFLIAFALSIKSLREPDLWWQIRTGEWILQHHQAPKQDVFSYTFAGAEWINVKWGFEVIAARISRAAGPESVFLIQAIVACLLVFFLWKIGKLYIGRAEQTVAIAFAVMLSLLTIEYRIIGRPEMFSHLLTAVFLFFLLRNRKEGSNKIFWLVPLQIIWANLHEAFGIGIVLTAIFVAGAWVEYLLGRKKLIFQPTPWPKMLSILLPLQIASVVINPNGVKLLTRPFQLLGQVYENKFTTELSDFLQADYWQWHVYLTVMLLAIGSVGCILHFTGLKTKTPRSRLFIQQFGLAYLLSLIAFVYLALTAYRNIVFLVLVFFPLLVFAFDSALSTVKVFTKRIHHFNIAFITIALTWYILIVSNQYCLLTNSRDRFGLEVLSTFNPVSAADYVESHQLKGKCFSDYLTSSYLLWRLPEFKTFIDLRDLDVFPSDFFNTFAEAVTFPDAFEKLDSVHHFDYVVLYRPQFASLHNYLFNSSRFKLAFADAVATVYVPKASAGDSSMMLFSPVKQIKPSSLAFGINKILNPFYSGFDYSSIDNDLLAAGYAINVARLDDAESFAQKSAGRNSEGYKGKEMLGEVYYNKALHTEDAESKNKFLSYAGSYYQQSLNEKPDYTQAQLGLGAVYFQQHNYVAALEAFEKCIAQDVNNLNAFNFAAECCKYFINRNSSEANTYADKAIEFYHRADKLNPDNPIIQLNLGLLYFRKGDCKSCVKYLSPAAGFDGFSEEQRSMAKECLSKCGK